MKATYTQDCETFPIGELSRRSGMNSITLRAWERRHGLLTPMRTDKGHRLYTQTDVERVLQILALIERGVPLRKIRPLLGTDAPLPNTEKDEDARYLQQVLFTHLEQVNIPLLAVALQEMFKQYPVSWCRRQVLLPIFASLTMHSSQAALIALLQSELVRYAIRYWPQEAGKKQLTLQVLGGVRTATWRTLLIALELQEKQQAVQWMPGDFSLSALKQLLILTPQHPILYCLDNVLSTEQEDELFDLLQHYQHLWLQGTAVELAFAGHERVLNKSLLEIPI